MTRRHGFNLPVAVAGIAKSEEIALSHPMNHARQSRVEKSRVAHLTRGYKSGGAVKWHPDEKQDKKLFKKMFAKEIDAEGSKSSHRMDRPKRAKGGRVGKHKGNGRTIVNVITGGHPAGGAVPMPPPMAAPPPGLAGAAMPPPGMGAKPPMPMPPPGAGGPPPGMPMRARGGAVKSKGMDVGTKVQHSTGKGDLNQMNRGRAPTYAKGGKVKRADGGDVSWDAGSGRAMLEDRKSAGMRHETGNYSGPPTNRAKGGKVSPSNDDKTFPNRQERKPVVKGAERMVKFATGGGVVSFRARGGRIESPEGVAKATMLPGGGGGGEARLAKAHREARKG